MTKDQLLQAIRDGKALTLGEQLRLVVLLSAPAMVAQISMVAMQYIDATMVARLGANAQGAIGLVTSTLWLLGGLCSCAATGFYVLVSHKIGAKDYDEAYRVLRVSLPVTVMWSSTLMLIALCISPFLPYWLGGNADICDDATSYFAIFASILPLMQLNSLASGMLRSAGNLKTPSYLNALMCLLDVVFNYIFIYIMDMGVRGAALGTVVAEGICVAAMVVCMLRQQELRGTAYARFLPQSTGWQRGVWRITKEALHISAPMGLERIFITSAQVASTVIVAPLGTVAIAANSLGITIESLCYMPGYGTGEAAMALVGQSHGAKRRDLVYSFSRITTYAVIVIMGIMGAVMYFGAPVLMDLMRPDADVADLCVKVLRIEAFAEPMYGASIICYYIFIALGDSLKPSLMNLGSIWAVRITLSILLAVPMGLQGVWLAMAIELCFRGIIFLIRMYLKVKRVHGND